MKYITLGKLMLNQKEVEGGGAEGRKGGREREREREREIRECHYVICWNEMEVECGSWIQNIKHVFFIFNLKKVTLPHGSNMPRPNSTCELNGVGLMG